MRNTQTFYMHVKFIISPTHSRNTLFTVFVYFEGVCVFVEIGQRFSGEHPGMEESLDDSQKIAAQRVAQIPLKITVLMTSTI